jgi:hypothetical protein
VKFNPVEGDEISWKGSRFRVLEVCPAESWNGPQRLILHRRYVRTTDRKPKTEDVWMQAWHQMCRTGRLIKGESS